MDLDDKRKCLSLCYHSVVFGAAYASILSASPRDPKMTSRPAFLDQQPPPGYVAGIGRGATGFTNHADSLGLTFSGKPQEIPVEDDIEDKTYRDIEARLQRQQRSQTPDEPDNRLAEKFSDLKLGLNEVSVAEWAALPEAQDFTRRNKRQRLLEKSQQRFYAAPDSLIQRELQGHTPEIAATATNFDSVNEARDQLLSLRLDAMISSTTNTTTTVTESEISEALKSQLARGDLAKLRALMASLRKTQPLLARLWLLLAQLEVEHQQMAAARQLILQATRVLPRDKSIWLEAIRIHHNLPQLRSVVALALERVSGSEDVWLEAVKLERDAAEKKMVVMKGIERLPASVGLWQQLIDLVNEDDKPKFAAKAMELCPRHWPFWAMVIETLDEKPAKELLNKARKQFKQDDKVQAEIWLIALKLEERLDHGDKLDKLAKKAVSVSADWVGLAQRAERNQLILTAAAITKAWLANHPDADLDDIVIDYPAMARAYYDTRLQSLTLVEDWLELLALERTKGGDYQELWNTYKRAMKQHPQQVVLALMMAKDQWKLANDINGARATLASVNPTTTETSVMVWGARLKLELQTGHFDKALELSQRSLEEPLEKVWYKHVHLLRAGEATGKAKIDVDQIMAKIDQGLQRFPQCQQLWLQKVQVLCDHDQWIKAESVAKTAPKSPEMLRLLALIYLHQDNVMMARSTLDYALTKWRHHSDAWYDAITLQLRQNNKVEARQLVARALQACPSSALIWALQFGLLDKNKRKPALVEALKACDNSSDILVVVGLDFWRQSKQQKALEWWKRAIDADATNGDAWIAVYMADLEQFDWSKYELAFDRINHGRWWLATKKDPKSIMFSPRQVVTAASAKMASIADKPIGV